MNISKYVLAACVFAVGSLPLTSHAAPQYRGFQVSLSDVSSELVDQLADDWQVNVARIQIGDDSTMDGLTGDDYIAMMEERLDTLDGVLPLFTAKNIKVVIAMYSPPGGFQTRSAPSHYEMFSSSDLQAEYLDMWRRIADRYKDEATIYAYDLLNEPAMRPSLVSGGAKKWNDLLPDVITAVREVDTDSVLMVKSLYGDPSKLASLPALNFANLIYSYHAYPFLKYQQTAAYDTEPFSVARPTATQISGKLFGLLAKFYAKQQVRYAKGQVPSFPPQINVGEAAVSGCATESGQFLDDLLAVFERNGSTFKKANKFRRIPINFKKFLPVVSHHSYTIHAYNESPIWDPRYECSNDGEFTLADGLTDRGEVLQSYFSKN